MLYFFVHTIASRIPYMTGFYREMFKELIDAHHPNTNIKLMGVREAVLTLLPNEKPDVQQQLHDDIIQFVKDYADKIDVMVME
jgi:hemerythrin-like domain-containing protein